MKQVLNRVVLLMNAVLIGSGIGIAISSILHISKGFDWWTWIAIMSLLLRHSCIAKHIHFGRGYNQ